LSRRRANEHGNKRRAQLISNKFKHWHLIKLEGQNMTLKVCMDIESEIGEDGGEALTTSNCKQYIDRCLLPVLFGGSRFGPYL
jgi:hypothetical protein